MFALLRILFIFIYFTTQDRIVRLMRALVNGKVASKPALLAMLRKDESCEKNALVPARCCYGR